MFMMGIFHWHVSLIAYYRMYKISSWKPTHVMLTTIHAAGFRFCILPRASSASCLAEIYLNACYVLVPNRLSCPQCYLASMAIQLSMPETLQLDIAGISLLILLLPVFLIYYRNLKNRADLPPGPSTSAWGNKAPKSYAWRQYAEWTKQYGPVISVRQGKNLLVVVGSAKAAEEIMEKQGAKLADRPRSIVAGDTLSGGMRTLLMPSGPVLQKYRKALHTHLNNTTAKKYQSMQLENALNLISDVIRNPNQHMQHAQRYAASVVLSMTYGKQTVTSYEDPEVQQVNECLFKLGKTLSARPLLVESFPFLRYLPGYLSEYKAAHDQELSLFSQQVNKVREDMTQGNAIPSFSKFLLEKQTSFGFSDHQVAYIAGSMFGAGSDTTASAISFVIMAAACFPDEQARVQAELDRVVGRDTYPTFEDESQLILLQAFVRETYRWRPVSIGGFAHKATEDIIWENYRIPAGTSVIGNHWSICHDPDFYPNPETFKLDRHIDRQGHLRNDNQPCQYGFGRRVCPGSHVANQSVFINAALLLWAFEISQDLSHPIDPDALLDLSNTRPKPFKVIFTPRIKGLEDMISHKS